MANTKNLGLYKPAIGEKGWGEEMNSNLDIISKYIWVTEPYSKPPVNPNVLDDEFNDGALNAKWSPIGDIATNPSNYTVQELSSGVLKVTGIVGSSGFAGFIQDAPALDFSVTIKTNIGGDTSSNSAQCGLILTSASSTPCYWVMLGKRQNYPDGGAMMIYNPPPTEHTSTDYTYMPSNMKYQRLTTLNSGTEFLFESSDDGLCWMPVYTNIILTSSFVPTKVGIGWYNADNTARTDIVFDFFRVNFTPDFDIT
jgi:hypothetical protein